MGVGVCVERVCECVSVWCSLIKDRRMLKYKIKIRNVIMIYRNLFKAAIAHVSLCDVDGELILYMMATV